MSMIISRKYEVLGQLGQGGMGVVYKVRHTTLDTIFALKVLPRDLMENPDMVTRFYREARVVARLNHPNIVRVSDIDHDDELKFHYFVMEYIQGPTFAQYLRERGPLPLPDVVNIVRQVANALTYAHGYTPPVVHRDIKPANIMIEDRTGRVVVMDFGIAKELDNTEMTKSGMVIGTVRYCAPEQMRREALDGRADIYSLGMVMYEAYTGRQFFAELDEAQVIGKALYDPQEHTPVFPRPAPSSFAALVTKAIAKARDQRHRTIEEFLRELDACDAVNPDATERIVLPSPATYVSSAEKTRDEVKELEAQIRKLEEERQKRLALSGQAQAQEARERAAQAGAARWAHTLFQEALTREEAAHASLREQQYPVAQEAYAAAERLFVQSYDEASAAAVLYKAEQARQEMANVKSEADRYSAREKARTFYGRGLALQARAEDLWEHATYQEAEQIYAEARNIFADARDLAYRETCREEALAAQTETRAAREAAIKEEAEQFAADAFQLASRSEQQATMALQGEDFFQARELYAAARQSYVRAQEQAYAERQRQHAPVAAQVRDQAEALRREVATESEQAQFAEQFARARQWLEQGQTSEVCGAYIEAAALYEHARQEYEHVRQTVEQARRVLREQVVEARAQALAAREQAERVGVLASTQPIFVQAIEHEDAADAALSRGDFVLARERYRAAAQEFARAAQLVETAPPALKPMREAPQTNSQSSAESAQSGEQVAVLPLPVEAREMETRQPVVHTFSLPLMLGAGTVLVLLGGWFFLKSPSSPPQPPVAASQQASLSAPASAPAPPSPAPAEPAVSSSSAKKPVVESAVTPPVASPQATASPAAVEEAGKFTDIVSITKYTDTPTLMLQAPVASTVRALVDGQAEVASANGVVQVALPNLPVGESTHVLRLLGGSPERTQDIPVVVRYYPRWEVRQFSDGRDEAYAVAFSPDGLTVASSSRDKILKLWNVETGEKIRTFSGHTDWVTGVAFAPDGQTLLSCSDDKTLRLWETATGKRLRTFSGHNDFVNSVAFAPDDKLAVSGSKDNTLKLWNIQNGRETRTLTGHGGWVLAVAFSPDGKTVVSGSDDTTVKLWDVKTGQALRTFSGHRDSVFAVAFSPDGKTIASGSHDKTVRIWDSKTGQVARVLTGHEDWVNGVAFSPDGRYLVSGGKDRTVRLWNVETGQTVRVFLGHEATIAGVAFSPDGKTVISGSRDKTLRLWWAAVEPALDIERPLADASSAVS